MQEKNRLEQSINLCKTVDQELNDNIELIEMGELEGDDKAQVETYLKENEKARQYVDEIRGTADMVEDVAAAAVRFKGNC